MMRQNCRVESGGELSRQVNQRGRVDAVVVLDGSWRRQQRKIGRGLLSFIESVCHHVCGHDEEADGPRRIAPSPPQSVHGHYPVFPRNSELPFVLLILQAGEGGSLRRYLLHSMLIDEHGNRMVAARLCRSRWNKLRRLAAYQHFF